MPGRSGPLLKRNLLLADGVHPEVVQEQLGYSRVSVTLDTYSQVDPSLQRKAAG